MDFLSMVEMRRGEGSADLLMKYLCNGRKIGCGDGCATRNNHNHPLALFQLQRHSKACTGRAMW